MIIGFCGIAGSGKGTLSDMFVEHFEFTKMSFADPLKDATAIMFGWDRKLLEGDTKESREFREEIDEFWTNKLPFPVRPRKILQMMGDEVGRQIFSSNFWVDCLERKLKDNTSNIVVADVRYPNEISMIKRKGGVVVRVIGKDIPRWYDEAYRDNTTSNFNPDRKNGEMARKYSDVHYSEWAHVGCSFDVEVLNDGTLFDLKNKADRLLQFAKGYVTVKEYLNKLDSMKRIS